MIDIAKHLRVGQFVRVESVSFGYHLRPATDATDGIQVVSVGADYVILNDEASGVRMRIPNHYLTVVEAPAEVIPEAVPQAA